MRGGEEIEREGGNEGCTEYDKEVCIGNISTLIASKSRTDRLESS